VHASDPVPFAPRGARASHGWSRCPALDSRPPCRATPSPGSRPSRVVELPAFGRPAPGGTALAPGDLAGQLLARIDALAAGPAVLFGHSASCQIVAAAAAQVPERVAGLVLVGPTTGPRASSWPAPSVKKAPSSER
jgi:pimeloyl-ACP methyl ester carboxylesterase